MMPSRFTDTLFQLVHSLEKAEKRNFKLYIKRSSAKEGLKIVELFDALDKLPFGLHSPTLNREDFSKFFCSELVAAAFERAGVTKVPINASEVTPIDLCRWRIYQGSYYQLKGDPSKRISRFNTASPSDWNVGLQNEYLDNEYAKLSPVCELA
jgi:hypothetical protein